MSLRNPQGRGIPKGRLDRRTLLFVQNAQYPLLRVRAARDHILRPALSSAGMTPEKRFDLSLELIMLCPQRLALVFSKPEPLPCVWPNRPLNDIYDDRVGETGALLHFFGSGGGGRRSGLRDGLPRRRSHSEENHDRGDGQGRLAHDGSPGF